jgi:hypothetical protein
MAKELIELNASTHSNRCESRTLPGKPSVMLANNCSGKHSLDQHTIVASTIPSTASVAKTAATASRKVADPETCIGRVADKQVVANLARY